MLHSTPIVVVSALFLGCGYGIVSPAFSNDTHHVYNATASIGDFLVIDVDNSTQTMRYENHTRNQTGTISYTISADGSYQLDDTKHQLLVAYEIAGVALVVETSDPAIISAVAQTKLTAADLAGREFNYLQFRTSQGGVQLGHVSVDANTNLTLTSYFPAGPLLTGLSAFGATTMPGDILFEDGTLGTIDADASSGDGTSSTIVFGAADGYFAIDGAGGSIVGWPAAAAADFDPAQAGTYKAISYSKNAGYTAGVEAGTARAMLVDIEISAGGHLLISGENGAITDVDLVALERANGLYGSEALASPCKGIFVAQTPGSTAETYVLFMNQAVAYASFQNTSGSGANAPVQYHYAYGVGLREAALLGNSAQ